MTPPMLLVRATASDIVRAKPVDAQPRQAQHADITAICSRAVGRLEFV